MNAAKNPYAALRSARDAGSYALMFQGYRPFGLSQTLRIYIFAAMFSIGFLTSLAGVLALFESVILFLLLFVGGMCLTIGSTCLLFHPVKQLRMAMDKVRAPATITFIVALSLIVLIPIAITFIFGSHDFVLVLLCLVIALVVYGALLWYSLSFIPFSHDLVIGFVQKTWRRVTRT
ncbi:Vesicle transport protein, Got1/SFT2-like [Carpediemonas membranifera]|uniref:Vesicle transport protein n=1 Tax=Carpediemonas membranifera TaxID=201153 RepID=A0A8J6B078_9EUKA|nr:Vesicle transport protein, Got1/SFT2-like [Carpediemonas membranifera]|eukprot:KAG9392703.1 Vesicle transport protein, Got1/SFT2-like [Carpediemonas membranifera]